MSCKTMTLEDFNGANQIDVGDIIARVEELRAATADAAVADPDFEEERSELASLESVLEDLCGNGGDEQWEGDWYPVGLIRDSYFEDYAREFAEACGMIRDDATWPCNCIDWDKAADELKQDYTTTEIDGVTYWYR